MKTTLQGYQQEVMKTLTILQSIMGKAVSEQQSKNGDSLTLTLSQQQAIKEVMLKWEQKMSQFVHIATESETQFSTEISTGNGYYMEKSSNSSSSNYSSSSNSSLSSTSKPNGESLDSGESSSSNSSLTSTLNPDGESSDSGERSSSNSSLNSGLDFKHDDESLDLKPDGETLNGMDMNGLESKLHI